MGCCSSSSKGETPIQNLKDNAEELQSLKGEGDELQRPASSTIMKNGELLPSRSVTPRAETPEEAGGMLKKSKSKRGKPSGLSTGGGKQLRDPNMIVTTPSGDRKDGFPAGQNDTIIPRRGDKQEAVAMFVSWEKPALGAKKKKRRGKKRLSKAPNCASKGKEQQIFIPGSGKEKILLADKSKTLKKLPPLKFKQVEGNEDLKSRINADRKRAAKLRKAVGNMNKMFKNEIGFDEKICKLIRQYADLGGQAKKKEVEVVMVETKQSNHTRTSYACPVKQ